MAFNNQCEEVESLERQFKTRQMHKKVEDITFRSVERKVRGGILDKNGKLFSSRGNINHRQVECITEIYDDDGDLMPNSKITSGENILKEEVEKGIESLKDRKATGSDEIITEAQSLDESNVEKVTNLCNFI